MRSDTVNILVVDDLPDKLLALEAVLQSPGQVVVTARSGREALRRVLEREFAVVLLDVNMPDMDGFETASLIRQRKQCAHTPIIFITSYSDEMHTAQGYSLGAVDYMFAPVVPEILRTKVGVFVDLYRKTEQVRQQAEERITLVREQAARAAAEEATRRSSFLAEVTTALASSLDHETTVRSFLRLVVPYLADLAGIALVGEPGQPWRSELAWVHAEDDRHAPDRHPDTLTATHPTRTLSLSSPEELDDNLRAALERVLASGKAEILAGLAIPYPPCRHVEGGEGTGPPAGAAAGRVQLRSVVMLPLLARGRALGALVLAMGSSSRRFTQAELGYAEDLAGRAAIAIDNARLYHEVQEADHRKNEFLAMLAHELRNPLAPIRSAVHILRLRGTNDQQVRWAQDVIDRQVEQMVRLVDDLLDVSRITRGKITLRAEPIELANVVSRAVETSRPLLDQRGHQLTVSLPPLPLRVEGDPTRLAQVVANLLNNAAKYTEQGGHIWLTVTSEKSPVVAQSPDRATPAAGGRPAAEKKKPAAGPVSQSGDRDTTESGNRDTTVAPPSEAVLRIRDSGIGIPANMLASIFDLFTQVDRSLDRSQGGLGIGLTLVRRLVEMHKGSVQAFSGGPGQGSEFVVRLPALPDARQLERSSNGTGTKESSPPRRVLVVDDHVDGAESMALVLRMSGHEVRVAHAGPAALEEAAAFRPEVVLLDIGLPGMDGFEVARQLRQLPDFADVLLVALTGYGREEDRRRARQAGFDVHLVKPVDTSVFPQLFSRASQRPASGPR